MSGLMVDEDLCIGCGRCVRACGSAGIEIVTDAGVRFARPTDSCIMCASCVDACPVDAIRIEKDVDGDGEDLSLYSGYWVFCQVDDAGEPLPVAFELIGRARVLADERGCSLSAVMGCGPDAPADVPARLIAAGADEVLRCANERLATRDTEAYACWLTALATERRPEAILYGATAFGRELAPAIAVRLGTGLTADCTVLGIDAETGLLQQTRPAFGGNLMATIECPRHRPQMATVRPGVFQAPEADTARAGNVIDVDLGEVSAPRVRLIARQDSSATQTITDADVLVVVGRGIGSKKNVAIAQRLADLLGGKLGCTRPVVEAGWLESWHQVGQTGVSVAPKLMVSLGVSGAIQHVAGIGGAECIVAVNEDPNAPIFNNATYRVEGDAVEIASALVEQLEGR